MDRTEFKKRLDLLRDELAGAVMSYEVYTNILNADPEQLDAINNLVVFFTTVTEACRIRVYLSLSKIFDTNSKSVSIQNILRTVEQSPAELVPNLQHEDFNEIHLDLCCHKSTIDSIRRPRNKQVAHIEVSSVLSATFDELKEALSLAENILAKLYWGCCGMENSYDAVRGGAVSQTSTIIKLAINYRSVS